MKNLKVLQLKSGIKSGPKKKKEPIIFEGVQYDSMFEVLFFQWLKEAIEHGFVLKAQYHPKEFTCAEMAQHIYEIQGKRTNQIRHQSLFQKIVYTADWWIYWTQKAIDYKLVENMDDLVNMNNYPLMYQTDMLGNRYSVVDVKPPTKMGKNASYRDFAIKAPVVWSLYGIYVQSVVPINSEKDKNKNSKIEKCFFSDTWAPKIYLERCRKDGKGFLMSYCLNKTIEDYEICNGKNHSGGDQ